MKDRVVPQILQVWEVLCSEHALIVHLAHLLERNLGIIRKLQNNRKAEMGEEGQYICDPEELGKIEDGRKLTSC